jgi:transposase
VRAYLKGQKNDFRDGEAIAEAVQRPTMKFVATKTAEQLDLQALHRVRARLVGTGIVNQIRAFLLERGVSVRKGLRFLRTELPHILATRCDVLSARMVHVILSARVATDARDDDRHSEDRSRGSSRSLGSRHQATACPRSALPVSSATTACRGSRPTARSSAR